MEARFRDGLERTVGLVRGDHAFGGLSVDGDDAEVEGVAPIVVWSRELGGPLVPFPERVVAEHWPFKQIGNCPFNGGWVESCVEIKILRRVCVSTRRTG